MSDEQRIELLARKMGAAVQAGNLEAGRLLAERIREIRLRQGCHAQKNTEETPGLVDARVACIDRDPGRRHYFSR